MSENNFFKNLANLSLANFFSQFILVIAAPILTRLYGPSDFGVFSFYTSIIMILANLSNFRYEQAIIIPKDENEAKHIFNLCIILSFFIFFISMLVVLLLITFFDFINLYIWLIPIGLFVIGVYQPISFWLIRTKDFKGLANLKVRQSVLVVLLQITLFKIGSLMLIFGYLFGQILSLIKFKKFLNLKVSSLINIKDVFIKYRKFPIFSIGSGFFNSLGSQLPILVFTCIYSPAIAGLYGLTQRVVSGPLIIVGQSIGQIFISGIREDNDTRIKLKKVLEFLIVIGCISLFTLITNSKELFYIVFGEKWVGAGIIAQIISPWLFLVFIGSPLSSLIEYNNKQENFLYFQIILFLLRSAVFVIAFFLKLDYIITTILFSIVSSLSWFVLIFYIISIYDIKNIIFLKILLKYLLIFFLFFSPSIFFDFDTFFNLVSLSVSVMISLYYIFCKGFHKL